MKARSNALEPKAEVFGGAWGGGVFLKRVDVGRSGNDLFKAQGKGRDVECMEAEAVARQGRRDGVSGKVGKDRHMVSVCRLILGGGGVRASGPRRATLGLGPGLGITSSGIPIGCCLVLRLRRRLGARHQCIAVHSVGAGTPRVHP